MMRVRKIIESTVAVLAVVAELTLTAGLVQAQYSGNGVGAGHGQRQENRERPDEAEDGKTWMGGKVMAVNGVQVAVQRREDNAVHTFVVTQSTIFHKHRGEQAVYQDVHVGDHVRAEGEVLNGRFIARHVAVFDEQQHGERTGRNGVAGLR